MLNREGQRFDVVALAAGENLELLSRQIQEFRPRWVSIRHERDIDKLRSLLGTAGDIELRAGLEGTKELIVESGADLLVNALVGAVGLIPTLTAMEAGIDVALANKESLVIGGHLVKRAQAKSGAKIIPIDSEHNAIFQLLEGRSRSKIARILLTASGGALRDWPLDRLNSVTPEDLLKHPTWQMGPRITVDSATLVNKAFEVIEAHWLFEFPFESIEVVIHPQSIIHGMIELTDGSLIAHLSPPDMRGPIQYALCYPERPMQRFFEWDWTDTLKLEFSPLDRARYPAFEVVVEAGRRGGTLPAVANAADEVLVERFLSGEIEFTAIARGLEEVLAAHEPVEDPDLEEVLAADRWARAKAKSHGAKAA
jgi:1-deoxy-D-xylulose-5-phosphate reductoisomerase